MKKKIFGNTRAGDVPRESQGILAIAWVNYAHYRSTGRASSTRPVARGRVVGRRTWAQACPSDMSTGMSGNVEHKQHNINQYTNNII